LPFIRVTRDKRGYEATLVMHAYRPTTGAQHGRVLYLFRSPTNVHLGRRALDAEVMEALEHTHPDLNFDWTTLLRDPALRSSVPEESSRPPMRRQQPRPATPPPAPMPVIVEDHTTLGRAFGVERAAALRAQYADLLQRIARRARTPEDRDRLTEQATRLNPEGWADEAAALAGAATAETEWQVIAAELPRRRRGRRGGRHAHDNRARAASGGPAAAADSGVSSPDVAEASGIMIDSGEEDDAGAEFHGLDREDRGDDRGRHDDAGGGAGSAAETSNAESSDADSETATGDGVPGDR
jgi:hypothetical protein